MKRVHLLALLFALPIAPTPRELLAPRAPWAPRLTVARLQYDGGGDWYSNPSSIPNLLRAIKERTTFAVEPNEARVTLMDDRLWDFHSCM